jgi:hypothetical protein
VPGCQGIGLIRAEVALGYLVQAAEMIGGGGDKPGAAQADARPEQHRVDAGSVKQTAQVLLQGRCVGAQLGGGCGLAFSVGPCLQ